MDEQRKQAMIQGHNLTVYEDSEQSDKTASEDVFDALWQSIYDVVKLVSFGIIDDISEDEYDQGVAWLKNTQDLTKNYQDIEL